ncbi:hypothetical protein [Arthrobacter zhaoxinii]|uniref:hypothetical protein n=1 Tax=Arthrobacter zhaoxinii TaxID=2964616 RepID=UPI0021080C0D|nr:hypothetical protein [Arthrobacter zhaoxinii]MCQ2001754.1 hypothetical protein [Arthrobacter zhaoxinii]
MDKEGLRRRTGGRRRLALVAVLVLVLLTGGLFTLQIGGGGADPAAAQREPNATEASPGPQGEQSAASPAAGEATAPAADGSGGDGETGGGDGAGAALGEPPAAGEINDAPQPVAAAGALNRPADVSDGVEAAVGSFEAVDGDPGGAAEAGGPSIRFSVTVSNRTGSAISLEEAVVNVEAGPDATPATQLSGPGGTAFPATLGAGESASAVFVFRVAPELRQALRILFHYQATTPIAAFEGPMPQSEGKQ